MEWIRRDCGFGDRLGWRAAFRRRLALAKLRSGTQVPRGLKPALHGRMIDAAADAEAPRRCREESRHGTQECVRHLLFGRRIGWTSQGRSLLLGVLFILLFFVFGLFRSESNRASGLFLLIFRGDSVGAAGQILLRKLQAV